jgi:hypothetical protein
MIIVHLSHGLALISSCADRREAISEKELSSSRFNFLFSWKTLPSNLSWLQRAFFKFGDSQRKTLGGWIITYIRVRLRDVPWRLAHEAKAGEVARLALGPLIILGAGGVIAGEVEVAKGCTRSGHHLLKLLLLIPETVLLLALALIAGVILVVIVVLVEEVELEKDAYISIVELTKSWICFNPNPLRTITKM